ncbi:TetR family transcriptional regulator [Roseomonas elaeocarpi]|uniref:TetR family transcriptional regulator n=1 Tax=Roseomonas elaeocarpi TaxID=907779 RepID=A0ABV6JVD0_9PROT
MARHTKAQAEQTREDILDAAEQVFFDRGVARSTLEEVARVAGVTRGAVYWHFRDKLDLFLTLSQRAELPHEDLLARLVAEPTLDMFDELQRVVRATTAWIASDLRHRRILTILYQRCEYVDEMAPAIERLRKADAELVQKLTEIFAVAEERSLLAPPWNKNTAAHAMARQFRGGMMLWLHDPATYPLGDEGLRSVCTLLRSMRGADRPCTTSDQAG